jgi:hypothetical protein
MFSMNRSGNANHNVTFMPTNSQTINNITVKSVSNGRIDIEGPPPDVRFSMWDKIPVNQITTFRDALTGNWMDNDVSNVFFSKENIQIIQNALRAEVYRLSNGEYTIAQQDNDELKIIMRALYLESAVNLPTNIREQVMALNQHVINHCVPKLMNEVRSYLNYKRDASNMYTVMTWPVYDNVKGKTLEMKPWF